MLIKYLVPPPVQKDFIQVFKEVKDGASRRRDCAAAALMLLKSSTLSPQHSRMSNPGAIAMQQLSMRRVTRTTTC